MIKEGIRFFTKTTVLMLIFQLGHKPWGKLSVPEDPSKQPLSPLSGLGVAYRIGIEFTSGILVGLLLGYAIDHVLDTQPWGLVVMVLLGASAGLLNIFRMLGVWNPSSAKASPPPSDEEKDG